MRIWFRFLFGTPARALSSLLALCVVVAVEQFAPGTIAHSLSVVGTAVLTTLIELGERFLGPLAWGFILPLIIVAYGFRLMVRGVGGGRRRRRRR